MTFLAPFWPLFFVKLSPLAVSTQRFTDYAMRGEQKLYQIRWRQKYCYFVNVIVVEIDEPVI